MRSSLLSGVIIRLALIMASYSGLSVSAQWVLPPGMFADTAHAPFLYGVASGAPGTDRMLIWTRMETVLPVAAVHWELAADSLFSAALYQGTDSARAEADHTVHVLVEGLSPGQIWYYRFREDEGHYSVVGRTKTIPAAAEPMKLAVMSCSSVFSGFFNAYARLAERNDLQAVIHLGDYIYDFVDEDEEVRVPSPYPAVPENLNEWRDRHRYYLLDPDLRALRAAHPLLPLWDNHDLGTESPTSLAGSIQAFREWLPLEPVPVGLENRLYRRQELSSLITLHFLDIDLFQEDDLWPEGEFSILGDTQFEWLRNGLDSSTSRWQLIGNQVMVAPWSLADVPPDIGFGDGAVLDSTSWDGFSISRQRLLEAIAESHPGQVMVLSGDAHLTAVADLALNPFDSITYDPVTGEGSVAVEFLPSSISRGNADEMGLPPFVIAELIRISVEMNPHQQHLELTNHGYGLLHVYPDSIVAESWYAPILEPSESLSFGGGWVVRYGTGHWERHLRTVPVGLGNIPLEAHGSLFVSGIFPNPNRGEAMIRVQTERASPLEWRIFERGNGRLVRSWRQEQPPFEPILQRLDLGDLSPGSYLLTVSDGLETLRRSFLVY